MTIPHNSGTLGNSIWSNSSQQAEEKDLSNGYVVGQDNFTGDTIVYDGSVTSKGQSDRSPELGKQVNIVRPNSKQKVRRLTLNYSVNGIIKTAKLTQYTGTSTNTKNINACGSGFGSADPPPPPPEEPPPDPVEEEITEDETEETIEPDTLAPQVCQDAEPVASGCKPKSTIQWFQGTRYTGVCPLGSYETGFYVDSQGIEWVGCVAPKPPIGDGCPSDPSAMGYECSPCGTCVKVKGGKYPTLDICQQSNCNPVTYTCTTSGCEAVFDGTGEFRSLSECQTSCSAVPYKCVDGNCIQALDGKYSTLEECQGACSNGTRIEFTNTNPSATVTNGCSTVSFSGVILTGGRRPFVGETVYTHADKAFGGFLGCDNPAYLDLTFVVNSSTAATGWVLLFTANEGNFSYYVGIADNQSEIINIIITPL